MVEDVHGRRLVEGACALNLDSHPVHFEARGLDHVDTVPDIAPKGNECPVGRWLHRAHVGIGSGYRAAGEISIVGYCRGGFASAICPGRRNLIAILLNRSSQPCMCGLAGVVEWHCVISCHT